MIVQIRSFLNQVCELNPKMNAAGFFDIGKKLFPAVIKFYKFYIIKEMNIIHLSKLIGTVLTYILVMLQFYTSETLTAK